MVLPCVPICFSCRHFRGVDSSGYVLCALRGETYPMLWCPDYRPRNQKRREGER